jgi:tetraacyldisaccharide 4'-kinase
MKTPHFWQKKGCLPLLLSPLGWAYGALGRLRWRVVTPLELPIPVICIGNLVAGGAGKTPVALTIGEMLKARNIRYHYLSRGYGGASVSVQPLLVTPRHTAREVGDEPKLLATQAPCWVSSSRKASATAAFEAGAAAILMDDGYQNPLLKKSLNFLVIDGSYGIGNGRLLPAGPLRERFAEGIHRADAVIFIGTDTHKLREKIPASLPCFSGQLLPEQPLTQLQQPLYAFAGIGRPEKFFTMLQAAGLNLAATEGFPDHHHYTEAELDRLEAAATAHHAVLTCTAKDAVKLPPYFQEKIQVVRVAFHFDDLRGFTEWLETRI